MINVKIDGADTIREEREIYSEFVSSKVYDFCKSGISSDIRGAVREWLKNSGYEFDDDRQIVEYIVYKI